MKRIIISLVAAAIVAAGAAGGERGDSLRREWKPAVAGVPMMVVGGVTSLGESQMRRTVGPIASHSNSAIDNLAPYSPLALTGVLKLCGVETRSSWGRLAVSSAFSGVIMAGLGEGLKHAVGERRPDAMGYDAFPSGHTMTAFTCATIMSRELGWRSPWYSVGAYTAASAIGLSRVMRGRHWAGDVVFGAGLGITATNLGYLFADMIYGERGLSEGYRNAGRACLPDRPSFLGIGMEMMTGRRLRLPGSLAGMRIDCGAAVATTAEGAWFFSPRWGVGGRFRVSSAPLGVAGEEMTGKPMDAVEADCAVWFNQTLEATCALTAKVFAGAEWSMATDLGDGRVKIGSATSPTAGVGVGVIKAVRRNTALRLGAEYSFTPERLEFTAAGATLAATTPRHALGISVGIVNLF